MSYAVPDYVDLDFVLEWSAVLFIIVGATLASLNRYPYNVFTLYIGTMLWTIWAVRIGTWSLIVVNAVLLVIYFVGVIQGIRKIYEIHFHTR
jgi:cellulose synthase/poly-beta-1,6-N-acetylglucosamine synthase-like glycosyltransferase